jgi:Holliday junction resolvase RusA-like endonuclease
MGEPVTITVRGQPAPQGSKSAVIVRRRDGTQRAAMIESSHERVKSWRQAVVDECGARGHAGLMLDGPLSLTMVFFLPRPRSHYRTGRNAHLLRDAAPARPAGKPDLSKLARSTEDALTDAGVWADDARVVEYARLAKVWAGEDPGALHVPGAIIRVRQIGDTHD